MKILIVHAHENPNSFCSALAETAKVFFSEKGHEVLISDLYQIGFNPVGGKHDFSKLSSADYYKYPMEQYHAHKNEVFVPELKAEMDKLLQADLLIFNFPLWWFGMPAILKGWVDRVLAYGFAYGGDYRMGENGRFKNCKSLMCITTGSPEHFYKPGGVNKRSLSEILRNIQEGILTLVGYKTMEPFIAYSVSRISREDRVQILENYKAYLKQII